MFDRNAIDEEQYNEIFNFEKSERDPDDLREEQLAREDVDNGLGRN